MITESLIARINLALDATTGETLIKARTARDRELHGAFYLVDWRGRVSAEQVDPHQLAEELEVL